MFKVWECDNIGARCWYILKINGHKVERYVSQSNKDTAYFIASLLGESIDLKDTPQTSEDEVSPNSAEVKPVEGAQPSTGTQHAKLAIALMKRLSDAVNWKAPWEFQDNVLQITNEWHSVTDKR